MYRTITLRLNHRYEEDKEKLLKTMEAFAHAYNMSAEYGFEHKIQDKIRNSMAMYHTIRKAIPGLPAAMVQSACFMATEALKSTKFKVMPKKSPTSSIRYSWRAASVNLESGYATIQVLACRVIATFKVPDHFVKYADWEVRCSYLRYDKGTKSFYLNVAVENQDAQESDNVGVLGIDRGLRNLAVCSNNKFFNSNEFKRVKGKNAHLRAQLQAKGTHSAKRKLKKLAGRERRFIACEIHRIAKEIASMPFGTFVLEDLTGIRSKPSPRRKMRHDLTVWPYGELKRDLEYKAEELGKEVLVVNGMYTSQKCSVCGHISHKNRKGPEFKCKECGFQIDADLNAARNIAQIGKSELGRLQASKPNATSGESVPIRRPIEDELSCKSKPPVAVTANGAPDVLALVERKGWQSTTSYTVECGWTGTRLGGYKPSRREIAER
jgi:putative transposase